MITTQVASLREKLNPTGRSGAGFLPMEGGYGIALEDIKYAVIALFCLQELLQQTLGSVSFLCRPPGVGVFVWFSVCYFVSL